MAGPWEKYAAQPAGPWTKYQAPAPVEQQQSAPSLGRQLISDVVRPVAKGVAALPLMAMDAGVGVRNLIEGAIYNQRAPRLSELITGKRPFQPYQMPSDMFNESLDSVTLPPQTTTGKVAETLSSMVVGAGLPAPSLAKPQAARLDARSLAGPNQAPKGFVSPRDAPKPLTPEAQTFKAGREVGYVAPPATVKPSLGVQVAEGIGGKAATQQAASAKNQKVTNELMRQELGLGKDTPITKEVLGQIRAKAGQVYAKISGSGAIKADQEYTDEVAGLLRNADEIKADFPDANIASADEIGKLVKSLQRPGFNAKSAMTYLRQLRKEASGNLGSAARDGGNPAKEAIGKAQRDAAGALEDLIIRHLKATGKADLADEFDGARTLIAKAHSVENALNPATGNVNARQLATQLKKGKPLSGNLKTAADFSAAFPKATEELRNSGPVSALDALVAGAGGSMLNPAFFAYPVARWGVRQGLLSPQAQNALLNQGAAPARNMLMQPRLIGAAAAGK